MKLAIVVPCYNEEEVISETANRLLSLLARLSSAGKISPQSMIYFVDDGSKDRTWTMIDQLSQKHWQIAGIKLSRNRGHQNALLAGLLTAGGNAIVSVDADLQDDIDVIEAMVDDYHRGIDIVYGVRKKRETDTFFKRLTAETFYSLIRLVGAESVYNHADYRLMSRRALESLREFQEVNLYIRGMVPLLGFKTSTVHYDRRERFAGQTKYPLKKMIALALDAITSFSVVPLRIITLTGFVVFAGTMGISVWILWARFFTRNAIPGWASTVLPMYFLGGIQIFCIGILGEYMGKIYREVKARPRYIIEQVIDRSRATTPFLASEERNVTIG